MDGLTANPWPTMESALWPGNPGRLDTVSEGDTSKRKTHDYKLCKKRRRRGRARWRYALFWGTNENRLGERERQGSGANGRRTPRGGIPRRDGRVRRRLLLGDSSGIRACAGRQKCRFGLRGRNGR